MSESEIEKAVCDYAVRKGCYERKFTSPNNRGVPDRMFITPQKTYFAHGETCRTLGQVFFIEFKVPGNRPTKLQRREMDMINENHGRVAFWCDSVEKGKEIVERMIG